MECYYNGCNGEMHIVSKLAFGVPVLFLKCNKEALHRSLDFEYQLRTKEEALLRCKDNYKTLIKHKQKNLGPRTEEEIKQCIEHKTTLYQVVLFTDKVVIRKGRFLDEIIISCTVLHYAFKSLVSGEGFWININSLDRIFYNKKVAFKHAFKWLK